MHIFGLFTLKKSLHSHKPLFTNYELIIFLNQFILLQAIALSLEFWIQSVANDNSFLLHFKDDYLYTIAIITLVDNRKVNERKKQERTIFLSENIGYLL